jgi:hypothetical protein
LYWSMISQEAMGGPISIRESFYPAESRNAHQAETLQRNHAA